MLTFLQDPRGGPGSQQRDRDRPDEERGCVEEKGRAGAERRDHDSPKRGTGEPKYERIDREQRGVRLHEQVGRNELRHDRTERRARERLPEAEEDRHRADVPQLQVARDREDANGAGRECPRQVGDDDHFPALDPIRRDPTEENERDDRDRLQRSHESHRRGGVGELVDLPRQGDDHDAVAEERDGARGPVEGEVPHPERRQELRPGASFSHAAVPLARENQAAQGRREPP